MLPPKQTNKQTPLMDLSCKVQIHKHKKRNKNNTYINFNVQDMEKPTFSCSLWALWSLHIPAQDVTKFVVPRTPS